MNVSCSDCGSVFRVDPAKVAREGVRAKCSVCGGMIGIMGRDDRRSAPIMSPMPPVPAIPDEAPDAEQEAEALMMPPAETLIESRLDTVTAPEDTVVFDEIPAEPPRALTPVSPAPIVAPPSDAAPEPLAMDTPVAPPPAEETPLTETPAAETPMTKPKAVETQFAPPVTPSPMARPALTPPVRSPTPRTTMPTAVPPSTPMAGAPVTGFRAGPAGIAGARPPAAPAGVPNQASIPTPIASPAIPTPLTNTPVAGAETAPRRPLNPFLANDPSAKAKRLARALVSDMIAYLPQKREEGLRDGTLKQIFREEIKKSYEEYVDQIGREIAENTTHFQEALNDLLAGGQKIF